MQIAARQATAADKQFAGRIAADWLQLFIQNKDFRVGDRAADAGGGGIGGAGERIIGGEDGRFGRAVVVNQRLPSGVGSSGASFSPAVNR